MTSPGFSLAGLKAAFDRFFFAPRDARVCAAIRIGVSVCVLVNLLVLGKDLELWFGERGVLPLQAARSIVDPDTIPLVPWFPSSWPALRACYFVALGQAALLLLGVVPRLQAFCVFAWLVVFQCRNVLLVDGGDTVMRLLTFLVALMPCGAAWSVDAWRARRRGRPLLLVQPAWALPLVQVEMTLIYVSTAWEKLNGDDWIAGIAIYYVARLDDSFGQSAVAAFLFESLIVCKLVTWTVLAFEAVLPIALWFRDTRRAAVVAGVLFHLMLDAVMHLFLFEWIMIVGLLSFVVADDVTWVSGVAAQVGGRIRRRIGRETARRAGDVPRLRSHAPGHRPPGG